MKLPTSGKYHYTLNLPYEYGWKIRALASAMNMNIITFFKYLIDVEIAKNPTLARELEKEIHKAESEEK